MAEIAGLQDEIAGQVISGLERELIADPDLAAQISYALKAELSAGVVKGGSIVAYRDEVRRAAVLAILDFAETDIADMGKVGDFQRKIATYISVERFVQMNLVDTTPGGEGVGTEGVDDDIPGEADGGAS